MPIRKVKVVHKFGIISHSKRLELQQRLAERVIDESVTIKQPSTPRKAQFSIDDDFVKQFNETEAGSEERLELESKAEKIFLRAKRKAGIQHGGVGGHVNLVEGWLELSSLVQCNSTSLQDDALYSLYTSLQQSPLSKNHIKSLLQLGHASMHWLTKSNSEQPYLRTGELGIIKVAHLIFIRLYYHHLAADIKDLHEERKLLIDIVDAFDQQQDIYRPFPASLLFLRTIVQIVGCLRLSLDEELYLLSSDATNLNHDQRYVHEAQPERRFTHSEVKGLFTAVIGDDVTPEPEENSYQSMFHDGTKESPTMRQQPFAPIFNDTSQTLWHSLDLWRILTHTNQEPDLALAELLHCTLDFVSEPMLDSLLALQVMSEAAKINHKSLVAMQQIARRDILGIDDDSRKESTTKYGIPKQAPTDVSTHRLLDSLLFARNDLAVEWKNTSTFLSPSKFSEEDQESRRRNLQFTSGSIEHLQEFLNPKPIGKWRRETGDEISRDLPNEDAKPTNDNAYFTEAAERTNQIQGDCAALATDVSAEDKRQSSVDVASHVGDDVSFSDGSLADLSSLASNEPQNEVVIQSSRRRLKKRNNVPDGEWHSSDESEAEMEGRQRNKSAKGNLDDHFEHGFASSMNTITRPNTQSSSTTTAKKWPWELAVSFVRCMGEICLHGNNSKIQRDAMIGCQGNISAGLLQFLKFQLQVERPNLDWSWRVRHVTVQQLMRVCKMSQNALLKDGLQNAAWTALISHHSVESDRRVLEAYKISRTEADLENCEGAQMRNTSLFERISTNLAIIYTASEPHSFGAANMESMRPTIPQNASRKKDTTQSATAAAGSTGGLPERSKISREDERLGGEKFSEGEKSKASGMKQHTRVTIRNEIMIAKALDQKVETYGRRSWKEVQGLVEDQWRKEEAEEFEIRERHRQEKMDKEIETLRSSLKTQSLKERIKR